MRRTGPRRSVADRSPAAGGPSRSRSGGRDRTVGRHGDATGNGRGPVREPKWRSRHRGARRVERTARPARRRFRRGTGVAAGAHRPNVKKLHVRDQDGRDVEVRDRRRPPHDIGLAISNASSIVEAGVNPRRAGRSAGRRRRRSRRRRGLRVRAPVPHVERVHAVVRVARPVQVDVPRVGRVLLLELRLIVAGSVVSARTSSKKST